MSKFQDKYRIESSRLKEWDYSNPWWYYLTINTRDHAKHFGKVENGRMIMNEIGCLVEEEWLKTKTIRPNVEMDYYVVMPNHFHGILIINETKNVKTRRGVSL
jgi:REP element-mobilizing transposase RayT